MSVLRSVPDALVRLPYYGIPGARTRCAQRARVPLAGRCEGWHHGDIMRTRVVADARRGAAQAGRHPRRGTEPVVGPL